MRAAGLPARPLSRTSGDKLRFARVFIDAHGHYPQTAIDRPPWGKRLIDWPQTPTTFPEEAKIRDPAIFAAEISAPISILVRWGPRHDKRMCSYATIHPASVDAFFSGPKPQDARQLTGQDLMAAMPPEQVCATRRSRPMTTARALLARWARGVDRLGYCDHAALFRRHRPEAHAEALGRRSGRAIPELP